LVPAPQTFEEEGAVQAVSRLRKVFGMKPAARPGQLIVGDTHP
jgi:hypothetical protein